MNLPQIASKMCQFHHDMKKCEIFDNLNLIKK